MNLFFDTETTGIPNWKIPSDDPSQPHIVSLAAVLADPKTSTSYGMLDVIIRPDGWVIDEEGDAFKTHGITQERAMDVGVPEYMAVEMLMDMCDGRKRVAYNTTFDNRIIRIASKRYFSEELQVKWKEGDYECAMIGSRKIIGGKQPKLMDAYKYFTGKDLDGAHNAMVDTFACMAVYQGIQKELHARQQL